MSKRNYLFYLLFLLGVLNMNSQLHCDSVELILEEQGNKLFTFDSFSKYEGGIARTTVARLKVKVTDKTPSDGLCSWSLFMSLDNNGSPINEWEELNLYSNGLGQNPITDLLQIRITNDCATSNLDGVFQTFTDVSAINIKEIIEPIILNALNINAPGVCGTKNVNGPGDYINNYSEFTFKIEVRIKPGMSYNPGQFALSVNFRLEENI